MKYRLMVVLEYNSRGPGHRAAALKDWLFDKLHMPGLELGTLEVIALRELPPEQEVDFGKDLMV